MREAAAIGHFGLFDAMVGFSAVVLYAGRMVVAFCTVRTSSLSVIVLSTLHGRARRLLERWGCAVIKSQHFLSLNAKIQNPKKNTP